MTTSQELTAGQVGESSEAELEAEALLNRLRDEADLYRNDGCDEIASLIEAAIDHIKLLRDGLDHIARIAAGSTSKTKRIRWLEHRARQALDGRKHDIKAVDMPNYDNEVLRLKRQLFSLKREFGRSGEPT